MGDNNEMGTINLETLQGGVFTEPELASDLKCKPAALRRMRREGRGPRWIRVGRLIRYPRAWVQEWIEANEGSGPAQNLIPDSLRLHPRHARGLLPHGLVRRGRRESNEEDSWE